MITVITANKSVSRCSLCSVTLQSQLIVLSLQILWSEKCDAALAKVAASPGASDFSSVQNVLDSVQNMLNVLADSVLHEQPPVRRRKIEHLVRTC